MKHVHSWPSAPTEDNSGSDAAGKHFRCINLAIVISKHVVKDNEQRLPWEDSGECNYSYQGHIVVDLSPAAGTRGIYSPRIATSWQREGAASQTSWVNNSVLKGFVTSAHLLRLIKNAVNYRDLQPANNPTRHICVVKTSQFKGFLSQWVYKGLKYCWDVWDCERQIQYIIFVYLKVSTLPVLSADNLIDCNT